MKTWIIPAEASASIDKLFDLTLTQDSVTDVHARVLPDVWLVNIQVFQDLVVRLTTDLELERAK